MATVNQSVLQRNLKRSLQRLLTVGQVFALVAWDLEPFVPQPTTVHWFRKLVRAINVAYCLAIVVTVGTTTVLHHALNVSHEFFPIRTLLLAEDVIVNVIVLLAMVGCHWSRTFYAKLLKELLLLSHRLQGYEVSLDLHQVESLNDKLLVGALLFFSTVSLVDWLFSVDPSCTFVCHTVRHILPNVIHVLALYQYAALQLIVYYCYRAINGALAKYGEQSRPKDWGDRLEMLRRAHLKLCDLTGRIVERFGPLIVCTVLSSFVVLNLELFNVYKATGLGRMRRWSANEGFKLVHTLLWIGLHGAKVLLILYPAHRGRAECDRTGPVLYKFAGRHEACGNTDSALMKFAGQLLLLHGRGYQSKACELVTLDLTLVSKLFAALTTYLVILIQFDSALSKVAH
uniref:Gustatory receptor n=1 Tax=Anopheles epiroticus TaxID=199890 RepID=A0A182PZ22_9DIPT